MRWGDNADSYGTASKYIRCWHNGLPVTLCVKWWMTNEGNLQAGPPCNSKAALPLYYRSKPFCLGSNLSNSSCGILLSSLSARLQRRSNSESFMLWSKLWLRSAFNSFRRSALISLWKLAFRRSWAMVSRSRCVSA